MSNRSKHWQWPLLGPTLLLPFLVIFFVGGCTASRQSTPATTAVSGANATELFERLKANQADGNLEAAAVNAQELINHHPGYALIDEGLFRAGEVAFAMERYDLAGKYYDRVVRDYPSSQYRESALLGSALCYRHLDMNTHSAEALIQLLQLPIDAELRDESVAELRSLVRTELSPADLSMLAEKYPASAVAEEIALQLARREYARGNYDEAYRLLGEFLYQFPEDTRAPEARRLLKLAAERRQAPNSPPSTMVNPNRLGVVLPITGDGSLYGRYFELGARLALEEHNATSSRQIEIVTADSKSRPVEAAKAVRRLIQEDGVVAIVGSVFSFPTVAASIESNAWQTPFLSPVVSSRGVDEVGPWVYVTKVPLTVEVSAIATVARDNLKIERFAVLTPVRGTGRELGEFFADEVTRLGGDVVALEYYDGGATDFRDQLERIRESAPDAIFSPGSVEELLLMLPQIKFYDLRVQLFGLSNWNSEKLLRLSRDELEGALFPRGAYHGTDKAVYENLKTKLAESGVTEVSPVTVSGYFGTRFILQALGEGASSREDVQAYLDTRLRGTANDRLREANALSILVVRRGRVREFRPPAPSDL